MLREITYQGQPLFFLADDMGMPWAGGWRSEEAAEQALEAAEACDWDASQFAPPPIDVEVCDSNGGLAIQPD